MAAFLFRILESRFFLLGCVTLFFVSRAGLVLFVPIEMDSDAAWYLGRALGIASGEGYSQNGQPTAYWPVGYPGFLGMLFYLFGEHQMVGQMANVLLAMASLFLVLRLARLVFRSETTARLALLLVTLYPNGAAYTPLLYTEIYFTFLILLGTYLFISQRGWLWVFLVGVIFGFAALTKPQVIFLPVALVLLKLFSREERSTALQQLATGLVIYLTMAALLVPWAARNTLTFKETVLISTNGGKTLLMGNNPGADGGDSGSAIIPDYYSSILDQSNNDTRTQVVADRYARELALQWIKDNPRRFVELIPLKIWHLWHKDGEAEWSYQAGYPGYERNWYLFRSMRIINQAYYSLLIVGLIVSIALLRKRRNQVAWPWVLFGYVFIIYLTLISALFIGQARFHFPAMPWIIMYAAWVVTVLLKPIHTKLPIDNVSKA